MKKSSKIILSIILIMVIAAIGITEYNKRTIFNDNYVNGNTPGNLYNAGLFCESNGEIFFSNHQDNDALYSMDIHGNNIKKLSNDTAMYINADEHYVYYVRNNTHDITDFSFFSYNNNSLCRIPRNGGKVKILDSDPCIYATLIGNYIYYLHYDNATASTLYKIKIDGTERKQLSNSYLFTCSCLGQYFYYNNPSNGQLYEYDTETDTTKMIYDCHCYKPIVDSANNAYYMDVDNKNALTHVNITSNKPIVLSREEIELYNVYGSYIYYQRGGKNAAICMIKNDGTEFKELAYGEYTNINVTSDKIFFSDYRTGEVYYTSTTNPGEISLFSPGTDK